jgi:uncharacterized protein YndB with AHSA1/START domain
MNKNLVAKAAVTVNAPPEQVWDALVNPAAIKEYMFGADVVSDWTPGSSIVWKGQWQGKAYEDKGKVIDIRPKQKLQYTHFSPLSGQPDKPENYHTVTVELSGGGSQTNLTLAQDNNANEEAVEHSRKNWETMLNGLKQYVEQQAS